MSEVKKFVLVPKEMWEKTKLMQSDSQFQVCIKDEELFPVIKKAKGEITTEKSELPPKELKSFH